VVVLWDQPLRRQRLVAQQHKELLAVQQVMEMLVQMAGAVIQEHRTKQAVVVVQELLVNSFHRMILLVDQMVVLA
jgi:hypothetical protein